MMRQRQLKRLQAGSRSPLTRTHAVYTSSRDTRFQIVEHPSASSSTSSSSSSSSSVANYLHDVKRVVAATFPEEDRRRATGEGTWEITMLQQNFFGVEFAPSCDLRVWNTEDENLRIEVSNLDLSDLPEEIQVPADIVVSGRMRANKRKGSRIAHIDGQVKISLEVDVPFPYSTFPGVRETIEVILSGVIARLELSLKRNLPRDYNNWARKKVNVIST